MAPSFERKPSTSLLRRLPLVATIVLLSPVLAFAQGTSSSETSASSEAPPAEASSATEIAAVVPPGTVSSYTEEQATRGKTAYTDYCSACHGTTLGGGGEIPGLAGKGFREHWFVGSPAPFFDYVQSNMPQGAGGSLPPETYADISSYLMSRNRVPAGDAPLPHDKESLANIILPPLTE